MMKMRAKMRVSKVVTHESCEELQFSAVGKNGYPPDGSDENNSFARWTPTAYLSMTITNPELRGKFAEGDTFYVDFTPAPNGTPQRISEAKE